MCYAKKIWKKTSTRSIQPSLKEWFDGQFVLSLYVFCFWSKFPIRENNSYSASIHSTLRLSSQIRENHCNLSHSILILQKRRIKGLPLYISRLKHKINENCYYIFCNVLILIFIYLRIWNRKFIARMPKRLLRLLP